MYVCKYYRSVEVDWGPENGKEKANCASYLHAIRFKPLRINKNPRRQAEVLSVISFTIGIVYSMSMTLNMKKNIN
jgi:hypothetical protein